MNKEDIRCIYIYVCVCVCISQIYNRMLVITINEILAFRTTQMDLEDTM